MSLISSLLSYIPWLMYVVILVYFICDCSSRNNGKIVSVPKKALLLLVSLLRARKRKMNDPDHGSGDYFGGSSPYQACRKKADTLFVLVLCYIRVSMLMNSFL